MSDRCRTCKAEIKWAITDAGRLIPLDIEPQADGNIRLAAALVYGGTPRAIVIPADRRGELAGELYRPHFATCPHAGEHRRGR